MSNPVPHRNHVLPRSEGDLDAEAGSPCWVYRDHQASYSSGVAVGGGAVFVPTSSREPNRDREPGGAVLEAATGEQLRTFAAEARYGFDGGPTVADGAVYIHGNDALRRFS